MDRAEANRLEALKRLQARSNEPSASLANSSAATGTETGTAVADARRGKWTEERSTVEISAALQSKRKATQTAAESSALNAGGFITEAAVFEDQMEAKRRKLQQQQQQQQQRTVVYDPPHSLIDSENPHCRDCNSIDIDADYLRWFKLEVCKSCRAAGKEGKYELITKTEARDVYLLTDSELNAQELPHILKPNPMNATWSNMKLYLRCQIEEFAHTKWGGEEGINKEFERRENESKQKKEQKFRKNLLDLRRRTRTSTWSESERGRKSHTHSWGQKEHVADDLYRKTCTECGIKVEFEEM